MDQPQNTDGMYFWNQYRFEVWRDFFVNLKFNRLMLTDVDAIFQGDPFNTDTMEHDTLYIVKQETTLMTSAFDYNWVQGFHCPGCGDPPINNIALFNTINCGSVIGDYHAIMAYILGICSRLYLDPEHQYGEQGIVFLLIYNGYFSKNGISVKELPSTYIFSVLDSLQNETMGSVTLYGERSPLIYLHGPLIFNQLYTSIRDVCPKLNVLDYIRVVEDFVPINEKSIKLALENKFP